MNIGKLIILLVTLMIIFVISFILSLNKIQTHSSLKPHETSLPSVCKANRPVNELLEESSDPILKKLHEYESVCRSSVTNVVMFFALMPTTTDEAHQFSKDIIIRLKEFSKYNIRPLVAFEPNLNSPTIIQDIHNGLYDDILSLYFQNIHKASIDDAQLGTWILFPEANTPIWHNTNPKLFSDNVVKIANIQRAIFPKSKFTILLNNISYESDDADWSNGTMKDLTPYTKNIPYGILDSIGYQGFPHVPPKNTTSQPPQLNGSDFINIDHAEEIAKNIHSTKIWINTGTFKNAYAANSSTKVTLSTSQRQDILRSITEQLLALKKRGFSVSVNYFMKDKSNEAEQINWSYWSSGEYAKSPEMHIIKEAITNLNRNDITLSLYDSF